ncbi:MAG: hypothetical protein R6U64_04225 [Bacteroidales bacterium]
MNQDNALRKSLAARTAEPPYGFEHRLMGRIMQVAQARSRRRYLYSLLLTALVSVMMLAGTFYALNHYFAFNILHLFAGIALPKSPLLIYCSYFSFLILVLLVLDYKLRQLNAKAQ